MKRLKQWFKQWLFFDCCKSVWIKKKNRIFLYIILNRCNCFSQQRCCFFFLYEWSHWWWNETFKFKTKIYYIYFFLSLQYIFYNDFYVFLCIFLYNFLSKINRRIIAVSFKILLNFISHSYILLFLPINPYYIRTRWSSHNFTILSIILFTGEWKTRIISID